MKRIIAHAWLAVCIWTDPVVRWMRTSLLGAILGYLLCWVIGVSFFCLVWAMFGPVMDLLRRMLG